jgi:hypothetical protein
MGKIRPEFIDENSVLLMPEFLPPYYKKIYDDVDDIFKTVFNKGNDIIVL